MLILRPTATSCFVWAFASRLVLLNRYCLAVHTWTAHFRGRLKMMRYHQRVGPHPVGKISALKVNCFWLVRQIWPRDESGIHWALPAVQHPRASQPPLWPNLRLLWTWSHSALLLRSWQSEEEWRRVKNHEKDRQKTRYRKKQYNIKLSWWKRGRTLKFYWFEIFKEILHSQWIIFWVTTEIWITIWKTSILGYKSCC